MNKEKMFYLFLLLCSILITYQYFKKKSQVTELKIELQNVTDHMLNSHNKEDSLTRVIDSLTNLLENYREVEAPNK